MLPLNVVVLLCQKHGRGGGWGGRQGRKENDSENNTVLNLKNLLYATDVLYVNSRHKKCCTSSLKVI
jgi:hypothetical protein